MIYRLLFLFIVMNSCAVHATKRTRSLSDVKYDMHHLKDELTKLLHRSRSDQPVTRQADKQSKNEEPENNAIPISCLSPEEKKQKFINNSSAEYLKQAEAAYANKQADYLKNIIIAIERQTGLKTFRLEELSTEKLEDLFTTYRRKKKFTSAQIPLVDRLNAPVGYITQSDYLLKWCNIPENACCNDSYDKNIDKIMYNLKKIATLLEVFNLSFCNKEISDDDKYRITLRQRLKSIALLHVNLAQTLAHARCGVRANATDLNLACEYYNKATSIYLDLAEAMAETTWFGQQERENYCNQIPKAELFNIAMGIPDLQKRIQECFSKDNPAIAQALKRAHAFDQQQRKEFIVKYVGKKSDLLVFARQIPPVQEKIDKEFPKKKVRKSYLIDLVQSTPQFAEHATNHLFDKYLTKSDLVDILLKRPELISRISKHFRNQYLRDIEMPREESVHIISKLKVKSEILQKNYAEYIALNERFIKVYPEPKGDHFDTIKTI